MRALSLLFFLSLVTSCTSEPTTKVFEIAGKTMGTTYLVKFTSDSHPDKARLKKDIEYRLKEVNRQMSTYIADSEISRFNQNQKANHPVEISPWFGQTLKLSLELADKTKGAFDPTIGPLVNLWGFGPKKHKDPPNREAIILAQKKIGFKKVILEQNTQNNRWSLSKTQADMYLDLSASAKGFGVDILSELMVSNELPNHLIEIGGELKSSGQKLSKPWRVAIEKPDSSSRSIQEVIPLYDMALATSGNYRNFYKSNGKTYPHTLNRKTGHPVKSNLLSASVLHSSCASADALATAFMVMGAQLALDFARKENIAALFIIAENSGTQPTTKVIETKAFKKARSRP